MAMLFLRNVDPDCVVSTILSEPLFDLYYMYMQQGNIIHCFVDYIRNLSVMQRQTDASGLYIFIRFQSITM